MRGDATQNVPLLGGDQLVIDRDPNTVLVTGAVSRPSLIRFNRGMSVQQYIELAGGPTELGDDDRAIVQRPSGISERVKRVAIFFHASPEVVSGATITVPEKPASKTSSGEVWQRVFASATALASLVLAYAAVTR
jgi:protein involved in polysaccharide export with SLBB domain